MLLIPLTKGHHALVDDEDYPTLSLFKWHTHIVGKYTYARARPARESSFSMHVYLLKPARGLIVHHKDNNGLNNQRSNLEVLTYAEHACLSRKRSGPTFRGVYAQRGRWVAILSRNYRKIYLGAFDTPEEAALAYEAAANVGQTR